MNGMYVATIIMTILMIWILLVSYHYAYRRRWGNENSAVDAIPENLQKNDHSHHHNHHSQPS